MPFSPQELAILRHADAVIDRSEVATTGRPTKYCLPPSGNAALDEKRARHREYMRQRRAKEKAMTSPTPSKGPMP